MTSAKLRLLALGLGLATLPLAACRHNDRYDQYESSNYRSDAANSSTSRMSNSSDNAHRGSAGYESTNAHNDPNDRGTTEPGSTSFSRLTGNLSTTLDAGFDRSVSAAEKAFTDLGYTVTDRKNEDKKSVIEAKSPEKESVKVTLKRKTDSQTEATIGVGMTGKQSRADLVLEKLLDDLK